LWLTKHEAFSDNYAKAQKERSEALYEEMFEIGDEVVPDAAAVAKARLRVDTRKWALARMNPKRYGDKITQEHTGTDGGPIQTVGWVTKLSESALMEIAAAKAGEK
jgi:hypothetical protein